MEKITYSLTIKYRDIVTDLYVSLTKNNHFATINDHLYVRYYPDLNIVKFFTVYIDKEICETEACIKEDNLSNDSFNFLTTIDNILYNIKRL